MKMKPSLEAPVFFWDLGTLNGRLYSADQGLISDQPTVIIRHSSTKNVIFWGQKAFSLLEKIPPQLEAIRTVERGVVADPMISFLIESMASTQLSDLLSKLIRPHAVVIVPSTCDAMHCSALKRSLTRAGFGAVVQISTATAIVMSFTPDLLERGSFVWDSGAGKTELTAISGGSVLTSRTLRLGGDDLDHIIQQFLVEKRQFLISLQDVGKLKSTFSFSKKKTKETYLLGRNLKLGRIETLTLSAEELRDVISEFYFKLMQQVNSIFMNLSPTFLGEIREQGIILAGGLNQIDGIDAFLSNELQVPIKILPRQHISPLLGAAKIWSQWETYSYLSLYENN